MNYNKEFHILCGGDELEKVIKFYNKWKDHPCQYQLEFNIYMELYGRSFKSL